MRAESLILLYAVPEKGRKKKFSTNMELAAILYMAETSRKKGGIVGFPTEKISFFSKLHYPLWAVPWENGCLIIDGLQILPSTLVYMALPDFEPFLNDTKRGETNREQFHIALEKHTRTFAAFSETIDIPMKAIVTDKVLSSDVSDYIEETVTLKANVKEKAPLIPAKLDQDAAQESMKKAVNLYERIQSDIKGLEYATITLNETMQFHEEKILHEIELADEVFNKEIDRVKPGVEKNVELLLKELDAKIEKMNRVAEVELNAIVREKERRHRELERLELKRTEYRRRLDLRRHRHDKIGMASLEHSLRTCENNISEVKETIRHLVQSIEKTREQNQEEVNKLKYGYQTLVDHERKKITDIEASRESVIKAKESENERLQQLTRRIVRLIEHLAEQKRTHATELRSLAIPCQLEQAALLGVPFYLVAYKTDNKFNYRVYPPLRIMSSEGIVKKIEKTLLGFRSASRIKLLLQPRSKALNRMFSVILEERMKADKSLEEGMRQLGGSNNLLTDPSFKEALIKGVEELKAEGWIKQEEGAILVKTYT